MLAAARIQQDKLTLKESALRYLDQTGQLASIKNKCVDIQQSNEKQVQIYSFLILIDIQELCQIDAELTNMVTCKPSDAYTLFQEVCFTASHTLGVIPKSIKPTQIHCNLRLNGLPTLPSYVLRPRDFFASKFASRFYQFVGVVCSMTSPSKYTRCAKYRCPISECFGSDENTYVRLHTAGAKEAQTVRNDFHCFYCGTLLVEDVNGRIIGDDLMPTVFLGGCFNVIGIPTIENRGSRMSLAFEANNILLIDQPSIPLIPKTIPQRIHTLYADRASSPWSFSSSLAYLFAPDIAPPGTFHKLKLHLLLSLMQSTQSENILDVLAVGKDTNVLHRLMMHAASFAKQQISHASSTPIFGHIQKDAQTGACVIEAGSVVLAHQGVCLLGCLDTWKKDAKERMRAATDSRSITLTVPHTVDAGPLQIYTMPLESTLWAYSSPNVRRPKADLFVAQDIDDISAKIPEGFSMVVMCDNSDHTWDEFKEASLIHQALIGAMNVKQEHPHQAIANEDFKQFIELARQQPAELTKVAQQLIQGYFVGSRRVRSSGVRGTPFPPAALKTLTSMAAAHAKLCLRKDVNENDATLAIMLYEESITARFGYSTLNVHPIPHFRDSNMTTYLGPENDLRMQQFQEQLRRFCANHDPNFSIHSAED
ncbi:minichromosome maintenance domain-containing protein 2 isoform X2 [Strongylocentrotus purpuratus]|uniref:Minichromosome maintenance domain-containing protein 2 n=1 Tax=Strongylocentrotus purpuratus TaxID=7668 RepID=A0A7M7NH65_STRPU|nr:minichromosome maintenance domain-containing protein 2 isoform X2 [Strongylocentrotus purpuratus]